MVWIIPKKRNSKTKSKLFSKYKNILVDDYFILQRRKGSVPSGKGHRPLCRIITRGDYPYYEIAYNDSVEDMEAREWHYIRTEIPKTIPPGLGEQTRKRWLIARFTQV
jgi:hypothetical protein